MYDATMLAPSNVVREIAQKGQAARIEAMPIPVAEAVAFDLFKEIFLSLKIVIVKINAFKNDAIIMNNRFGINISGMIIFCNNSKSCNGSLYNSKRNDRSRIKIIKEIINRKK